MVSTTRPMSKDLLPYHSIDNQPPTRTLRRLSHGLVMDLKQAVQLEKQELNKMGLSIEVDMAQPKMASPEQDTQLQDGSPPLHWLDHQQRRKSSVKYGGCPPCSPPVPIPQHHQAQSRYSTAGSQVENLGVRAEQVQMMSSSPCEAKLYDELWNFKLSLEYQESHQALTCQEMSRNNDQPVNMTTKMARFKDTSESSRTSTVKRVNVDDKDFGDMVSPEEEKHVLHYGDVFVMDDL